MFLVKSRRFSANKRNQGPRRKIIQGVYDMGGIERLYHLCRRVVQCGDQPNGETRPQPAND